MEQFMFQIVDSLKAASVDYYIVQGTALGAARNQHVIPWTNDIDIALAPGSTSKLELRAGSSHQARMAASIFFMPIAHWRLGLHSAGAANAALSWYPQAGVTCCIGRCELCGGAIISFKLS